MAKTSRHVDKARARVLIGGDYCPFWLPSIKFPRKVRLAYQILANSVLRERLFSSLRNKPPRQWKPIFACIARSLFPLGGLEEVFRQADVSSINLECVLCSQGQPVPGKRYHLAVQTDHVCSLLSNNIKHVALANNHILDLGHRAADETLAVISDCGITYSGLEHRPGDEHQVARRFSVHGTTLGILSYLDPTKVDPSPHVFFGDFPRPYPLSLDKIIRDTKAAKADCDLVLVHLHWGKEWSHVVEEGQRSLARRLIEEGVSVVIGHHPHVVQDYEEYLGGLIFYSLGNLFMALSDVMRTRCRFGLMPLLYLTSDGIDSYQVITTEIDREDRPIPARPVTFDSWTSDFGENGEPSTGICFRLSEGLQNCRIEGCDAGDYRPMHGEHSFSLFRIPYSPAFTSPAGSMVAASREFYGNDLRYGVTCFMKTKGAVRIVATLRGAGRLCGFLAEPDWFSRNRPSPIAFVTIKVASHPIVMWCSNRDSTVIDAVSAAPSSELLIEIINHDDQEVAIGLEIILMPLA
jgi:hypothetical protein